MILHDSGNCNWLYIVGLGKAYALAFGERGAKVVGKQQIKANYTAEKVVSENSLMHTVYLRQSLTSFSFSGPSSNLKSLHSYSCFYLSMQMLSLPDG